MQPFGPPEAVGRRTGALRYHRRQEAMPGEIPLGGTGLKVTELGFGCMGITAFYGEPMEDMPSRREEDAKCVELLQAVYDMGYRHFDSAEVYKTELKRETKHNEEQLAQFFKTVPRESYTIATKFFPGLHGEGPFDLATVEKAVDASLARLGLECVDLYYCHRPPKTWELAEQWMESEARWLVGVLAGVDSEDACHPPRATMYKIRVTEMLSKIEEMATKRDATAAQLSLAWLYYKAAALGLTMIAIPGTTKIANAKTNLDSLPIKLSKEEADQLEELAAMVAGERGNESYQGMSIEGNMKAAA
eukprot:s919_g4.t1